MIHLYIYADQLEVWAHGNLLLLSGTAWFVFMMFWDMALILEYPEFLALSSWMRTVPYGLSLIFLANYYSGLAAEILKLRRGQRSLKASFSEIVFAYLLWINTPTAIIATFYAILLPQYTDDIEGNEENNFSV